MLMRYGLPLLLIVSGIVIACTSGADTGMPSSTPAAFVTETASPSATRTTTPLSTASATASQPATATPLPTASVTASQPATPTPALVPKLCPIAFDACSFANQVALKVTEGNGEAMMSSARSTFYLCPGPSSRGSGDPFPLCNDASAGETRAGFPFVTTFQGEGSVVSEAQAALMVSEWSGHGDPALRDEYGDGGLRAYSIACADIVLGDGQRCDAAFSLIFSELVSIEAHPARLFFVIEVNRSLDGELRAYRFGSGMLLGPDPSYALRGGTGVLSDQNVPAILAPLVPGASSVTFFPWDTSALIR